MPEYLVLVAPSANRVYADAAPLLVEAEARVVASALAGPDVSVLRTVLAGVDYVQVQVLEDTQGRGLRALSNLSATHAIFQREGELLRPVPLARMERYPSDLLTIQKYRGKTNEQWTRLVLNVTAAAARRPERWLDGGLVVLDPMCGRGTTLNLAMSCGYDVIGVDLDRQDYEAYGAFIKTWLRQHRLKHTVSEGALRISGENRGRRLELQAAATKDAFKTGDLQQVTYLSTDTTALDGLLKSASVDLIVTDTPYGVQHGSHGDRLSRRPLELLATALPGWTRILRAGGAVGLSYNRHVAPQDELADLLRANGLECVQGPGYDDLRHRVDASIDRDLIVARKA
ncbi:TRM11 family SAM-dependent methyltransferase [Leekyejoonella antrihumi]|uniref:SAM-dependent methyltransferase n=1 Tax=Leekyejoonella antrihumi TaxID=1660198 RepID=A0A563DWA1_9MICO|nr:SAM-dependent methyltransferase [Leekyejoonella antrihumi]TWP34389.1 SAM-dependent methyltransferase [Leekyejoonella antrihumi]